MKMKAAVFREAGMPIKIEEVNLSPPKEKEVLVKTMFTGFCHSDFTIIAGQGRFPLPSVIGHEASGVVVEVGDGVTTLQKGDHVVASWSIPCGKCKVCMSGHPVLCTTSSLEDPVPKIQELTEGGADFVFEVTGDVGAIVQVYWAMGVGGKHIQVGVPSIHETASMQLTYTPGQHRDIIGCLFGDIHVRQDIPKFVDMVMNGNYISLDKLITKKFRLEEIGDVYDAMAKHEIIGRWVCEFD